MRARRLSLIENYHKVSEPRDWRLLFLVWEGAIMSPGLPARVEIRRDRPPPVKETAPLNGNDGSLDDNLLGFTK